MVLMYKKDRKVPLGSKYLFKLPFKIFKEMEMSILHSSNVKLHIVPTVS